MKIGPIRKAVIALLVAGSGAGAVAASDDRITYGEWWLVAATALASFGAVYGVRNRA